MTRRRLIGLALAEILAVFLLTRLRMLTEWPYLGDEGWHGGFAVRASQGFGDLWGSYEIGKEPLVIWLAAVWIKLGVAPLDAVRLVSFCSALVTLGMVGVLARRLAGTGAALAAMGVYALLPLFVVYDVTGLMDPFVAMLAAVALYVQIRMAQEPSLRLGLALGALFLVGVLSKETAKGLIALLPLSLVCFDWRSAGLRERLGRWGAGAAAALGLAGLGVVILHAPAEWDQVPAIRGNLVQYPVRPLRQAFDDPFNVARDSWAFYRAPLNGYLTIPVAIAAVAGVVLGFRAHPRRTIVMAGWVAIPFVAALLLPLGAYPRHLLICMPPLIAFAGVGLGWAARRAHAALGGGGAATAAVAAGLGLALLPALRLDARILADPAEARYPGVDDAQYVTGISGGAIWPDVARELRRRAAGRPAVVVRYAALTEVLALMVDDPGIRFVDSDDPAARRARFVVRDVGPFPDARAERILRAGRFRVARRFQRPRHGAVVTLYERS